jgi:phosphate starvation-inducible PhoH-like protein
LTTTFVLEPENNKQLINTCGPLDENIQEIAKKLDIKISRNGFKFSLAGADQKIKIASDMLEHFYLKAKNTNHP